MLDAEGGRTMFVMTIGSIIVKSRSVRFVSMHIRIHLQT